jgi:hypothetical protein
MGQIANIDYFYKKCNQQEVLYPTNTSNQAITVEWVLMAFKNV